MIRTTGAGRVGVLSHETSEGYAMRGVRIVAAGVLVAGMFIAGPAMAGSSSREVEMQDRCDPASFDAALGDGACAPTKRGGKVTFPTLVSTLLANGSHPKWRFSRDDFTVKARSMITVTNTGGEFHTFTRVDSPDEPGCVPDINGLIGRVGLSTHCAEIPTTGSPSGVTFKVPAPDVPGTYSFICLIHPWMASTVTVER